MKNREMHIEKKKITKWRRKREMDIENEKEGKKGEAKE